MYSPIPSEKMTKQLDSLHHQPRENCFVLPVSKALVSLLISVVVVLTANPSSGDIVRQYESRPRPNEVDTAARGGQVGGVKLGRDYRLMDLRCGVGEAIVGLRTRRGSVLDYVQINCARPVCDGRGCQWSSSYWGAAAGNSGGGDPQPPMVCGRNEIVSGIRGQTVTFTVFDYATDIEIECSALVSPSTPEGFFPLGQAGGGSVAGLGSASDRLAPEGARGLSRTPGSPFISCRVAYGFGATAVSVGESDFVRRGQRVVQAVSLYCPNATRPAGPDAVRLIDAMDRCLREKGGIVYYSTPNKGAYTGRAAYDNSTVLYDSVYLDREPPYMRALWLADAIAAHVLGLQRQRYPVQNEARDYRWQATDVIVGYLMHCLSERDNVFRAEPRDPRLWFRDYRRLPPDLPLQQATKYFDQGWWRFPIRLPPQITMD